LITDAKEKEIQAAQEKYDALFLKANDNHELEKQVLEQRESEIATIKKKYADEAAANQLAKDKEEEESAKKLSDAKMNFAMSVASGITEIANLVAGDDEKRAKKAFALSKSLAIAEALANTYASITTVLASKDTPTAAKPFVIAASVATGLAAVAKISATKFTGGASTGGGAGGGGALGQGASATPQPTAAINFGGLPRQEQQAPIPAYVIGSQIQSNQEASQRVKDLSSL
jgi:hypothetical protein